MAREVTRRRPRDDEEEERRPVRRSRRSRDEDEPNDEAEQGGGRRGPSRRSRDDEDERPTRRSRSESRDSDEPRSFERPSNMGRGRASVRKNRDERPSGDWPDQFRVEKEPVLIKFLDDDFFSTFYEHFIQEFKGQKRQMTFVCLGDDCPLCEIGDKPGFRALINVVDLSKPSDPKVKLWSASANPAEMIEEEMPEVDEDGEPVGNIPPINDPGRYFEVSKKKGKNNFFSYKVRLIRARDLEEEGYDFDPLTGDEIDEFTEKAWTEETAVRIDTRKKLNEIADELDDRFGD